MIEAIDKAKDVDGFHPLNVAALWQKQPCTLPCTPKGIIKMLKAAGVGIAGKEAVVIGRSNIVGLPVSKLLLDENCLLYTSICADSLAFLTPGALLKAGNRKELCMACFTGEYPTALYQAVDEANKDVKC